MLVRFFTLLLFAASTVSGSVISNSVSLSINGVNETSLLGLPSIQSGSNSYTLPTAVTVPGVATISFLGWSSFDDPFINYFMGVQNLTTTAQTYSFAFTNPYLGGPYTILHDSFTDSFTDGNQSGTVTIGIPSGSTSIAQPFIDGVNRDGQGVGCTVTSSPGFSGSCNSGSNLASFPISTYASGTFGVAVNFTLSPGDIYTFNGHVDLANSAVPEPATYTFMFAAFGLMSFVAFRRRSRRA